MRRRPRNRGVTGSETPADADRANATVGWVLLGAVALSAVHSVVTNQLLWSGFEAVFVVVAALPPLYARDWRVLAPWPLLLVGAVALVGQSVGLHQELTGYTAVAAFALVGVAQLEAYTEVEMTRRFALAFGALTTMAVQGVWTVVRYASDQWLGSDYVQSQAQIQWDFVFVTLVAVVVGAAFELYFRRSRTDGTPDEPTLRDS